MAIDPLDRAKSLIRSANEHLEADDRCRLSSDNGVALLRALEALVELIEHPDAPAEKDPRQLDIEDVLAKK